MNKKTRIKNPTLIKWIKENLCCMACGGTYGLDAHHVKSKGSGGHDINENLIPLCRKHHTEWHKKGTTYMNDTYSLISKWLMVAGWGMVNGKWRR